MQLLLLNSSDKGLATVPFAYVNFQGARRTNRVTTARQRQRLVNRVVMVDSALKGRVFL